MRIVEKPWSINQSSLESSLHSSIKKGLNQDESKTRLEDYGKNRISQSKELTFKDIFFEEIREPLILMLIAVGVIYSIWGKLGDAITIFFIITTLALVEVYTEYSAKKRIESLRKLSVLTTWVYREGKPIEIKTEDVVIGDILILRSGERISADARVIQSFGLEVDESQLTGESITVPKYEMPIDEETALPERINMVHMGSVVVKGRGTAIVTATGMDTELGKIAGLAENAREPKTPMQKAMKQLSMSLVGIAVLFSVIIPVFGLLRGLSFKEMVLTGFSLAFATIPEEMPIIITMVLGLGAINLSKKNVLIRRLKAAETLGSVTVIATDKTGTLTQNKMEVSELIADDETELLKIGVIMADVVENEGSSIGDPMDKALLDKAKSRGIMRNQLLEGYKLLEDSGFDIEKKIFTYKFKQGTKDIILVKGAPESIIELTGQSDKSILLDDLMKKGSRIIGFAYKENSNEPLYKLLGFVCFHDPIREGVKDAIDTCKQAGVRVVMITGDHINTAQNIAKQAGMSAENGVSGNDLKNISPDNLRKIVKEKSIFARITPEQKLNIVEALRNNGEVIAVTGDGVNDAPALKAADIGVSMGETGTDVAKEASDMVLTNDSFISVVEGIKEGRKIFENLSKCVKYYLACKIALVICFLVPLLIDIPLPFAPIQIILLELFMDLAASSSFVKEPMETDVLKMRPRDTKENFMNRRMISGIFAGGITLSVVVLTVFLYSWYGTKNLNYAQTMAFCTWLIGHVVLGLNMRTNRLPLFRVGVFSNTSFNIWIAGVIVFLLMSTNIAIIQQYLKLTSINVLDTLFLIAVIIVCMSWMEIKKFIRMKGRLTEQVKM